MPMNTYQEVKTRENSEIDIRDTFILPYEGKYYMYGTKGFSAFSGTPEGFVCYVGTDLKHWTGPYTVFPNDGRVWARSNYWAPEVYAVNGAIYLFAAWCASADEDYETNRQYMCVLRAEHPLGPFQVVNDRLGLGNDPTLYCEDGEYYIIHNVRNSHMQAHKLAADFSSFVGDAIPLFDRTDQNVTWSKSGPTEGPETYVTPTGKLLVLWSSLCEGKSAKLREMGFENADYGTAIAYAPSGTIYGPFEQENVLITPQNMGHVNLFETFDGQLMLATHWPDDNNIALGCSTPVFFAVEYDDKLDTIRIPEKEFQHIRVAENGGGVDTKGLSNVNVESV